MPVANNGLSYQLISLKHNFKAYFLKCVSPILKI